MSDLCYVRDNENMEMVKEDVVTYLLKYFNGVLSSENARGYCAFMEDKTPSYPVGDLKLYLKVTVYGSDIRIGLYEFYNTDGGYGIIGYEDHSVIKDESGRYYVNLRVVHTHKHWSKRILSLNSYDVHRFDLFFYFIGEVILMRYSKDGSSAYKEYTFVSKSDEACGGFIRVTPSTYGSTNKNSKIIIPYVDLYGRAVPGLYWCSPKTDFVAEGVSYKNLLDSVFYAE